MLKEFSFPGHRDTQQDVVIPVRGVQMKGDLLLVVADGHCLGGMVAAQRAVDEILTVFMSSSLFPESTEEVTELFLEVDRLVSADMRHRKTLGGATLTVVYVSPSGAIVANVGDSPAYLISRSRARFVTEDHSTDNKAEVERLERLGYRLVRPLRIYMRPPNGARPGLQTTRTVGDPHMGEGLRAVPYVSFLHGRLPGDVLLVCTDGVPNALKRLKRDPDGVRPTDLAVYADFDYIAERFVEDVCIETHDNASGFIVDLRKFYDR